ncbi:MAG TPA: vitamin K epoxide reductase family protein [Thermoplasmata archaeon]|nr:vitamin K epoxide reductase family protein [Thermoplasmata archaeon]
MARTRLTRGDLWLFAAILAGFAVADAAVLTWQWYAPSGTWCDLGTYFSCTRVRESPFASVAGIPMAGIGLAGFAGLLGLALAGLLGVERLGPLAPARDLLILAGVGGVLGAVLTGIEVFVIESVCLLCAIGFGLDLGVLGLAWRLRRNEGP